MLPKRVRARSDEEMYRNTFDIVKKTEANKGARKVEIAREFKGDVRMTFKQIKLSVRITCKV